MKVPVYNMQGKEVKTVSLPETVFGLVVNPGLVQQVVVAQQANARVAIAHTKTRAEVSGGGKKPWRQKGTGRARHGSTRSPIWRTGGITFGPRSNRNFSKKVNTKAKNKALAMTLTDKVHDKKLIVLDALTLEKPKTKLFATMLQALPKLRSHIVVLKEGYKNVLQASRNIPNVRLASPANMNTYDTLAADGVVITEEALQSLIKRLEKK
jgi:large subunit ribosomal protein L4